MTKGEIHAVIFVAVSMLAGAVILLVKQYDSDFLPDLGPVPAHGRLNAGVESESAADNVDDSNARLPSTRADSGHPANGNLLVPVNTAPASELQKLPGIGPKLAEAIIDYRTRSGPFERVEQLLEVKGIGPAKLGRIRPLVKLE